MSEAENPKKRKVYIQRLPSGDVYALVMGQDGKTESKKHLGHFSEDEYEALLDTINEDIAVNLDS